MDERKFSEKSDVWSFGITCWEVFSYGLSPYNHIKNLDVQAQVRGGMRLERPSSCPEPFYALLHRCWLTKAAARPSFHDLRTEIVNLAKPIKQEGPMRDVGASLAKAGKETVYVSEISVCILSMISWQVTNTTDRDFDDTVAIEDLYAL